LVQILDELLHPIAQLRRMHTKVLRRLGIGHAPFLDQSHSLKLELARKLSSLHDPPPAPSIGVFRTGCRPSCPQLKATHWKEMHHKRRDEIRAAALSAIFILTTRLHWYSTSIQRSSTSSNRGCSGPLVEQRCRFCKSPITW